MAQKKTPKTLGGERLRPSQLAQAEVEDRQDKYGHPHDVYERAAVIFTGILFPKLKEPVEVHEVALLMEGLKLAREAQNPAVVQDNPVDGCGYWDVLDMIYERQGRPYV